MAHFYRLIVAALLLFLTSMAHAFAPTPNTEYGGPAIGWYRDLTTACYAHIAALGEASNGGHYEFDSVLQAQTYCVWDLVRSDGTVANQFGAAQLGTRVVDTCPSNSTLGGGTCTCDGGYQENSDSTSCLPVTPPPDPCLAPKVVVDGVCVDPPPPPECQIPLGSISNSSTQQYTADGYGGGMMCFEHCSSYPTTSGKSPEGPWSARGPWTSTGVTCSGSGPSGGPSPTPPDTPPPPNGGPPDPDAPTPQDPPFQCPTGQCPGSVNGTNVCVPCTQSQNNTTNTNNTNTTTTNPDGSPVTPPEGGTGPGSNDGNTNTNTTTSTTCSGSSCVTTETTTTTNADGTTTTTNATQEKPKETFCTENPKSPLCVEGSFGGACGSGFQCNGDAIQCAIAREQHVRSCSLFEDMTSPEAQLYQAKKGLQGDQTTGLPGNSTVTFGPASFNTSNAIGGSASCMPNLQVTVMGASLSLPFNVICPYLGILGNILMAISFLLAARIFMRG